MRAVTCSSGIGDNPSRVPAGLFTQRRKVLNRVVKA
jgi:hypothetical protein